MIRPTILLLAMTIVLLLSSVAYTVPDTTGGHKDTIAIQVLEERVKQSAEKTQTQVEALQKQLDVQNEAINHRVTDLAEESTRRTEINLVMAVCFLTFLTAFATYFGRRTLVGWIKQSISDKTDVLMEQHKAGLVAQAVEAREKWVEVDKAREEYESLKNRMEKKVKELAALARPTVEPGVGTTEFQKKLSAVKDEADFTAKDWYLLGQEAYNRGDWEAATTRYSNSIKLDPKNYWGYSGRGLALYKQGLFDEVLKDLDKALEIHPERIPALQNAAEVRIMLGQYDDAQRQASKAQDLSVGSKEKATSLYLKCIAEKLLGKDISVTESELNRILEEDFEVTWSFDEIEKWLETADISEEAGGFIRAKTAQLKTKQKKQ